MLAGRIFKKIIEWRVHRLHNKNLLIIDSIFIGLFSGLAAVLLKSAVHYIQFFNREILNVQRNHYLLFVLPLMGILITVLYDQFVRKGKLERGVARVLYAISRKGSVVDRHKTHSHVTSSAITVGFGGSVGLEAPIVVTGAAIGSNVAQVIHVPKKERTLLLACGAAAGIAGIFNAPIAGVIFAIEVLLAEFTIPAFVPLIISSVTGAILAKLFLGEDILFYFLIQEGFRLEEIPFFALLGLFAGLVSVYFTRMNYLTDQALERMRNPYLKAGLSGSLLGLLIFIFPPLYGEGYDMIKTMLASSPVGVLNSSMFEEFYDGKWTLVLFAAGIILTKVFASTLTLSGGGNGGVFAPSLFVGAFTGFFFARLVNMAGYITLPRSNFVIVGMAGVMSGVLHAPLTGVFLIAELTGGYALFIPLMIVSAIAYFTARYFEPHSIYTRQLAQQGDLLTHDKDKNVLTLMQIEQVIEKDLLTVPFTGTLGDLVKIIARSHRNVFPVVDHNEQLKGIIMLDDIRSIMFKPELYEKTLVKELMHLPPAVIRSADNMEAVMKKFDNTGAWNLPVVENDRYVGFVSKANIFSSYRKLLREQSEE